MQRAIGSHRASRRPPGDGRGSPLPPRFGVSLSLKLQQNALLYLSALAARLRRFRWARDGDAVVFEERIAEARGVRSGYRCLALLHRAEAAVRGETITIFAVIFAGAVVVAIALGATGMVIAFNTVVIIRLSFHLAGVADDLIYVRSERELSRLRRASASTHSAAAAFVSVGLPSFLPSAKLRTIM
jgi:hypothetical protein